MLYELRVSGPGVPTGQGRRFAQLFDAVDTDLIVVEFRHEDQYLHQGLVNPRSEDQKHKINRQGNRTRRKGTSIRTR